VEYGLDEIIRLAFNENPLGTSPKAAEAMKRAVDDIYMYPEGSSIMLRRKVAANFGINEDMVIFGNGADNILLLIAQAFVNEGEEIIIGDPTFSVYETVCTIMGGTIVKVPLKDFTYDLTAIFQKITEKTKLIFICNPNNPTGTIVTEEQVARFMEGVPSRCVVIFDEAYAEFAGEEIIPGRYHMCMKKEMCLMIRTLSKVFGLAGARVGYAIGPKHLMDIMRKVVEPFPVNRLGSGRGTGRT
jgi:histidinol-phosphate aminotransferase